RRAIQNSADCALRNSQTEKVSGILANPVPIVGKNPVDLPVSQNFARLLGILSDKKPRAVGRAGQSFMRTAGDSWLTRPIRNRWRQPPGCKKGARLIGTNGHRKLAQLL